MTDPKIDDVWGGRLPACEQQFSLGEQVLVIGVTRPSLVASQGGGWIERVAEDEPRYLVRAKSTFHSECAWFFAKEIFKMSGKTMARILAK